MPRSLALPGSPGQTLIALGLMQPYLILCSHSRGEKAWGGGHKGVAVRLGLTRPAVRVRRVNGLNAWILSSERSTWIGDAAPGGRGIYGCRWCMHRCMRCKLRTFERCLPRCVTLC